MTGAMERNFGPDPSAPLCPAKYSATWLAPEETNARNLTRTT